MKVGIYNSGTENSVEGDTSAAVLAEVFASKHHTEIIRTPVSTTAEQLRLLCDSPLQRVAFRTVCEPSLMVMDPSSPEQRYKALRSWSDEITEPYDLFINFSDRVPIYCSAPRGVLVVRFPSNLVPSLYRALWLDHLASYQLKLSNSYYTRFWTRMFWEIDCPVVYPPVPLRPARVAKENLIVAVGPLGTTCPGKELELILAFKQLKNQLPEWSLSVIDHIDGRRLNESYFTTVCDLAADSGVTIVRNPSVEQQSELFNRAQLLWLANGLSEDLEFQPEKAIPFSLPLIQGMAAGCVPLVTNSGGLSEVLRHGENGFFWNTTSELIERSLLLARDEPGRLELAKAAHVRALDFRPERFIQSFLGQLRTAFGFRSRFGRNPLSLWHRLFTSNKARYDQLK
jgi:glycosyltransferase involved in cell wall biosynthesis